MATFAYRALTESGERRDGDIEAMDRRSAILAVQALGLLPIDASPKSPSLLEQQLFAGKARVAQISPELTVFTRELATLLRAGEPLERAMALIADETGDEKLSEALKRVVTAVRGGRSLAQAIEVEPKYFTKVYVGMVSAGEATGQLHQVLDEIALLAERQYDAKRKFIASITYPMILSVVAVSAVGFMLGLVVPQFAPLLEGHEAKLPALTVLVLSLSNVIRSYGPLIIGLVLVIPLALVAIWRIEPLRRAFDRFILNAGWLGRLPRERITAQFARSLSTLLRGGLNLPNSISMSAEMIDNLAVRDALNRILVQVQEGQRLADALQRENILAPMGRRLIRTGEESGRLAELTSYLADQMDRRIADRTARLLSLLEPVLVVGLGLVVGGITVAILSAMLSVNEMAF